ncbi:MAG: hypothetical protein EPN70_10150 [Paraburkholderia sp.]|uniref:hypothetical protein n=1 Tax=Paraburkholderia sp. TaxID=1926495 RepID=UPI0012285FBC|nr:hypothetical protein [Paraburkholderia sp.]TAM04917.1 MAG: hypothetical protein EPN70_10150 [Paraburkholderia sp.]TAM29579.1 MAG: hypothetical protein EPN59_11565 [Paraburkholderia sp.]
MKQHVLPAAIAAAFCGLLGGCANGGPDINGFVQKANSAVESAIGSVTGGSGAGATAASGPVYTPISGGSSLSGLFAGQNQQRANYGQIPYPRVALDYLTYGANLPCWKIRATIWSSPKRSHDEVFQICDAPIVVKDAVGQAGTLNTQAIVDKLDQTRAPLNVVNTGEQRTRGPLPPLRAMSVPLASTGPMFQANPLQVRLDAINARIAYIAGYVPLGDSSLMSVVSSAFYDYRIWIWKFEEGGQQS